MNYKKVFRVYDNLFQSKAKKYWKLHKKAINKSGLGYIICAYRAKRLQSKMGASFPVKATISKFSSPHSCSGVFISSDAVIGEGCTIYQQVVIGSNSIEGSKGFGAPVIGNNVLIGAGAKIIGNVKIGNNVRIGANCCIATDIPDNATVVMEKPRIIIRNDQ